MLVQKDFLNKLKEFGLNSYESKLWTALLSRGISTAGELSDIANVPRSRSYDVLESLEKKGFIIMKLGKPIKYIAVPPEEVMERLKKKLKEDVEKQVKVLEDLKETNILNELNLLHKQGIEKVDPSEISGSFRGRENLYNHLESMIKNAKKLVVIMTTGSGLIRKEQELKKVLKKAKENGVDIKIASNITKDKIKNLELSNISEIKQTNEKSRFVIVDEKEVFFMLLNDKDVHPSYDVGVWIKSEFFAKTFQNMFNSMWKDMKRLN